MEGQQRPRFCKELDGNIGKLIFGHVKLATTRLICRAVCRHWRLLVSRVLFSTIRQNELEAHVSALEDEHMGVLRLWTPVYRNLISEQQRELILLAVSREKPSAACLFLVNSSCRPDAIILRAFDTAIAHSARKSIQQVLLPAAVLAGKEAQLCLRLLLNASHEIFEWFGNNFYMKFPDPKKIELRGKTPKDLDAKLMWMQRQKHIWTQAWWTSWFYAAAGVRHHWTNSKGKKTYAEPHEDDRHMYNGDVAVAILQHVLNVIPADAHAYFTNRKLKISRARDDALLSRLKAMQHIAMPKLLKRAKIE